MAPSDAKRRHTALLAFSFLWKFGASDPGDGDVLRYPPELTCSGDETVTLVVRAERWVVPGVLNWTTRIYCHAVHGCNPIGPTILVAAGTTCKLTVINELDGPACAGLYPSDDTDSLNRPHCGNTTNLHLHGLFVSPREDDVSLSIEPGQRLRYEYNFPSDLLMGTHWYHAHHHGSSNLQVQGGLVGALLTTPGGNYPLPAALRKLYGSARILVLSHVFFNGTLEHPPPYPNGFDVWDYAMLQTMFGNETMLDPQPAFAGNNSRPDVYLVNGQHRPVVLVTAAELALLRLVHGGAVKFLELTWSDPRCTAKLVARDGVFQSAPYLELEVLFLAAGSRSDVAVFCEPHPQGEVYTVTITATPNPAWNRKLGTWLRHTQANVFTLRVTTPMAGIGTTTPGDPSLTFPELPTAPLPLYLASLVNLGNESIGASRTSRRDVLLGDSFHTTVHNHTDGIDGAPFDGTAVIDTLTLDTVLEWTLYSSYFPWDTAHNPEVLNHPYHQHVFHFQIIAVPDGIESSVLRVGEWRDTIPIVLPLGVVIRLKPSTYTGTMVLHCHMLQHGDMGMMARMQVVSQPVLAASEPKGVGLYIAIVVLVVVPVILAGTVYLVRRHPRWTPAAALGGTGKADDDDDDVLLGESDSDEVGAGLGSESVGDSEV